ncbi:MAG: TonB-dependent receptor [Bacteroidetes bacterium]|nr:TonB-dependent receptor [Bacteroidota bacterium]
MKKLLLLLVNLLVFTGFMNAQGIIRGKVTDDNGEPVVGATLVLKSSPTTGTITDFDGNFTFKIPDNTAQVIVISYISFQKQEIPVQVSNGQVLIKNIVLKSATQDIGEVEIVAKVSRERDGYMEKMKMNSASSVDYISTETIKKTGDSYVVAAVARVSGVSTTSNGFITVRGIGDRYVKTTLNGSMIPTLDPFTNNFRLDLFPTSLIDNVSLLKTARPDIPGDWAGAYINVLTKDYPDQLSINVETSFGYNTNSTFKDVLTSQKSSTDWLGYDNSFRDIDHDAYIPVIAAPTQYQQMVALGLGNYFSSLGVTSSWLPGSDAGETYFKLGLVQLGLLGPALFNDFTAVAAAKDEFISGQYSNQAYTQINTPGVASSKNLPNNWNTSYAKAPIDFSQSFSIGNQIELFGKPLGFIGGFRYGNSFRYDDNSVSNRAYVDVNGNSGVEIAAVQKAAVESNGWSALANLAYKLNSNNSISLLFMPNFLGVNKVRDISDQGTSQSYNQSLTKSQFYEQRKQLIYQLKTEHYIPAFKAKWEWNGSYTTGKSSAPDFKSLTYFEDQGQYLIDIKESDTHRYYRYLDENMVDASTAIEIPIFTKPAVTRKIKVGGGYQKNDRLSEQFDYKVIYNGGGDLIIDNNDIDSYFDLDEFGFYTDSSGLVTIDKYYEEPRNPANNTIGYSEVISGFVMSDYAVSPVLRFAGGLRIENAVIFTDVKKYDELGYEANDPRRQFPGEIFTVNPGSIKELSFLPSLSVIYKIDESEKSPITARLNYSRTVARPGIRELSDAVVFDYEVQDFIFGNSNLKTVSIDNYDARLEYYFNNGDNFSVSPFFKNFTNHIELVNTNQGFTWQNVDKSTVRGIEIEGRKKISKNFDFLGNVTLVKSQTEFVLYRLEVQDGVKNYIPIDTTERTMFGQAPFVVNGIINYTADSIGLSIALSYNIQGKKLVFTSTDGTPDIFEMPRHNLDLKISKKLSKHFNVSLKVQNILDESTRRSYIYDNDDTLDYDRYTYGTTYTLGFSYKL